MDFILCVYYEIVFVDVGIFEDRRNIIEWFDYFIYYVILIVMVVEFKISVLLNRMLMDIWGCVDSIFLLEYI